MCYIYFTDTKTTENSQFSRSTGYHKKKLTKRHRNIQEQQKKKTAKKLIKTKTIIQTKTKHRGELCFTDNAQRLRHI